MRIISWTASHYNRWLFITFLYRFSCFFVVSPKTFFRPFTLSHLPFPIFPFSRSFFLSNIGVMSTSSQLGLRLLFGEWPVGRSGIKFNIRRTHNGSLFFFLSCCDVCLTFVFFIAAKVSHFDIDDSSFAMLSLISLFVLVNRLVIWIMLRRFFFSIYCGFLFSFFLSSLCVEARHWFPLVFLISNCSCISYFTSSTSRSLFGGANLRLQCFVLAFLVDHRLVCNSFHQCWCCCCCCLFVVVIRQAYRLCYSRVRWPYRIGRNMPI